MLFVRNWPRCHHLYACDSYSLIVIEIGLRHQVLTQTIDSELLRLFVKCKNVKGTELVIIVSYSVNLSRIIVLVGLHAKITLPKTAFIWFDKKHFIVINVIITCKQIMLCIKKTNPTSFFTTYLEIVSHQILWLFQWIQELHFLFI